MPSQGRPMFNQAQEQAVGTLGSMGLVWRTEWGSLLKAMFITLLLIAEPVPHQWGLIALIWIGTLFRFIEAWRSWNSVKISRGIHLFVIGVCVYLIIRLSNPSTFLHSLVCSLCAALGTDICQGFCVSTIG